ncbi:MAG: hypothetical protein M1825_002304 [Sarcosagium campestre]|nr:MAG: hypothetical protein M1825_002304 [Sarcosagium campestre]
MLAKQIVDLSEEHFGKLETPPPEEVMSRVPSNIPSFLANTPASRQLRSAYIQHVVSDTLCYRVFQPFLFSLGRRYDKADGLFQAMSTELRNKSTHKEAVWRQHTLYAAYTASTAKKATNAAAGAVVEEIVDHIRHFAEPGQLDLIYASVRRIVKIAAETWRYARLEREMITARMPPADATDEDDSDWPPPAGESWSSSSSLSSSFLPSSSSSPSDRKTLEPLANSGPTNILLLLRLLPIISREPIHESLQNDDDDDDDDDDDGDQKNKLKDNGCRYSQGVALYSDSKPVLARLQELQTRSLNRDESTATAAAFPTRTTTTTTATATATATGMPTLSRRERPQSPRAHDAAAGSRSVAGSRSISRSRNTKTRATTIGSSSSSPPAPPLSSPRPSSPRTESRDARARAASTARTAASRPTSPMSNSDVWAAPPPPLSSRPGSRPTSVMMTTTAKPELSDWS